ncbi:hypothetical protein WJX73_007929 [Symbiochloris irregularis]|uniref:Uncharacterized protein n=1 Tax=Symbiochloris irregularis TaxID=706552 RepID=A0AAW1Q0D9_9CHLO
MLHLATSSEARIPSPTIPGGWHVTVALKHLPRFPGWNIENCSQAEIVGGPRWLWEAKNSRWVNDRKPLEDHLRESGREGLLADESGCLLEGLTSNLFVIAEIRPGEFEVQTAAVHHRVLEGIMRRHVLQACAHLRLPLQEISPVPRQASTWRAAFLTSSVRLMQPLDAIFAAADRHALSAYVNALGDRPTTYYDVERLLTAAARHASL